jgi:hypothetical protein
MSRARKVDQMTCGTSPFANFIPKLTGDAVDMGLIDPNVHFMLSQSQIPKS